MSSRSAIHLSVFFLCGIAMVLSGLVEALVAQQVPPPLPPPEVSRPGGQKDNPGSALGRGGASNRGGSSRRRPSFRGADSSMGKAKPKFEDLLENKDLSRFRGYKSEAIGEGWEIDGKYLHFDGSTGTGDIITRDEYDNFELQFDFKVSEGGNSGVMYRVSLGDEQPYFSGPEFQVLDDEQHADGKNELTSAGSLYALYAPENKKSRAAGTWNDVRIIVDGNSVTHYLNGVKVVQAEIGSDDWNQRLDESKFKDWEKFGRNSRGHIAFQDHGDEVWYRNIRIKALSPQTAARSDRSDRSDSRSGGGALAPPALGKPPTRRRPSFSSQGSGLDTKKGDDKDDRADDDRNSRRDNRSDNRDDRSNARGGALAPPSLGTPPSRRRPSFSSQGSGLDTKKGDDRADDDRNSRRDSRSDNRDDRSNARGGALAPPSLGTPPTRRRPSFSSQGSGLDTKKGDDRADDDRNSRRDSRSDNRDDRSNARGGALAPPSLGTPPTRRRPSFSSQGSGLDTKKGDDRADDDRNSRRDSRSDNRDDRSNARGGALAPPSLGTPPTRRRPSFSSQGSGLDTKKGDDRADDGRDSRSDSREDRSNARGGALAPPSLGTPPTRRRPRFSSQGSGLDTKKGDDKDKDAKDKGKDDDDDGDDGDDDDDDVDDDDRRE